ncbi:MAG: hypothetical protein ACR2IF_13695 [Terriglobales bacterium]
MSKHKVTETFNPGVEWCVRISALMPAPGWRAFLASREIPVVGWGVHRWDDRPAGQTDSVELFVWIEDRAVAVCDYTRLTKTEVRIVPPCAEAQ